MKLKPLSHQVVVITGATSGIGLATARQAARRGAKVVLVARNEPVLQRLAAEVGGSGEAIYAVADVAALAEVKAVAAEVIRQFGRIDTWVSNAGVAIYSDLLTTPRDEHEQLFRTNYWGAVNSAEAAAPHLAATGGALIFVGSIASDIGTPVMGAYAASKHAVKGYVDSLRIEFNRDDLPVSVTLIKPSGVDTPLTRHIANHRRGEPKIPPPIYTPNLVARSILWAAEHPTREVTVGGLGLAQVLFATHFPGVFAKTAGAITALLNDPKAPASAGSNLFGPLSAGETEGDEKLPKPFSLYTSGRRHPLISAFVALSGVVLATAVLRPRKGFAPRLERSLKV